ncbi:MAG: rhomboid family intramembrane serine protease [Planctomycetes bacterium]|nr:rhomboid family intramembrane serine protease [Planctomycetota bacterium]
MGWQDREYARGAAGYRPAWSHGAQAAPRGRSIVTTLIIINVVVYALATLVPGLKRALYDYGAMQAAAVLHGQVWRLITAQYLHDPTGIGHLLINMIGLHFLGRPLERMWSPRKFFTIYTLCGLSGNVFYTILGAAGVVHLHTPAVGASGSIYGLLGIVAVLFPTATVYVYFLFPIKIRTAAMIFGGIAVWSILKRGSNFGGEACHLAGLVFGVWWSMRGDSWWARTGWRWPLRRTGARRAKPGGFETKIAQRREDAETIDRILKKVYEGGIHNLTDREKRALQAATERQRQREADAGRVDRL